MFDLIDGISVTFSVGICILFRAREIKYPLFNLLQNIWLIKDKGVVKASLGCGLLDGDKSFKLMNFVSFWNFGIVFACSKFGSQG